MEAGRMTFKIVCQVPDSETISSKVFSKNYKISGQTARIPNRQDPASFKEKKPVDFHTEFAPTNR